MASKTEFSRTLSLLRQERGVSQRTVAKELGISQALLSHYENGIREPGLAFVIRACNYYRVSADFILGRTPLREGQMLSEQEFLNNATESDHESKENILAKLQSKLICGAVGVLFELLGQLGSKKAIRAASSYLGSAVYQLYRHLYRYAGANEAYFSLDSNIYSMGMADADMKLSEARYVASLRDWTSQKGKFPDVSTAAINKAYPGQSQSLTQVLSSADARLSGLSHQ